MLQKTIIYLYLYISYLAKAMLPCSSMQLKIALTCEFFFLGRFAKHRKTHSLPRVEYIALRFILKHD